MKDVNKFTAEVLEKVRVRKKKKRIKNVALTCLLSFTLVFLVLYSNILPITSFDYLKYTYELYDDVYASEEDDTIFSFANNSSAILSIDSVAYRLDTVSNTKTEFNFNATKIEKPSSDVALTASTYSTQESFENDISAQFFDTTNINVTFYDGGATISGNFYGIPISIDVVIIKNSKLERGVWKCFDKDNSSAALESYIIVNEKGEAYYIDGKSTAYELLYLSVFEKEYTVLLDNYGAPSEFITVERLSKSEFGFDAIKLVSYIGNPDRYFKMIDSDALDFQGGELTAKYVNAKKTVEYLDRNDFAKYLPIKWRLIAEQGHKTQIINSSAHINLKADRSVSLTVTDGGNNLSYQGEWFATDKYIVVILTDYSLFGKTFVIYNQNQEKSFSQNAKTNVVIRDGFKTGYHDFDYYLTTTNYTLYWGSEYTEEDAKNVLIYEKEYVLNGYYYKWYYNRTSPFNYDTETLPENGKVKIIIHENGTIDVVYENRTKTIRYYKKTLTGTETLEIKLTDSILLDRDGENYIKISYLYLVDGALTALYTTFYCDFGPIHNHYIMFVR